MVVAFKVKRNDAGSSPLYPVTPEAPGCGDREKGSRVTFTSEVQLPGNAPFTNRAIEGGGPRAVSVRRIGQHGHNPVPNR